MTETPVLAEGRWARWARWYEECPRPRRVLMCVVLAVYGATLLVPFFTDDFRVLRHVEEYHAGERGSLDLYRFFKSTEANEADFEAGVYPWWYSPRLRADLMRPLSELSLYLDYVVYGVHAWGFHLTALAIYLSAVLLLLDFYRLVSGDEGKSRWAALIFAIAPPQGQTVAWIASRADVLSLLFTVGALLFALWYVRRGGFLRLVMGVLMTCGALFSKESAFPVVGAFGLSWLVVRLRVDRDSRGDCDRRAWVAFVLMAAVVAEGLLYRSQVHSAANAYLTRDPMARPWEYLGSLPIRLMLFMSTWPLPLKPAMFFWQPRGQVILWGMAGLGVVVWLALAVHVWRRHRGDRAAVGFLIWPWAYLPVLSCALPDDRLMILPMIGLAYVGACWLRSPYDPSHGSSRTMLRTVPVLLLLVLAAFYSGMSGYVMYHLESKAVSDLRDMAEDMDASGVEKPVAIFLNSLWPHAQFGFMQDRAWYRLGVTHPYYTLVDVEEAGVEVVGPRTLRLTALGTRFFNTLPGQTGVPDGEDLPFGEVFERREFSAKVVSGEGRFGDVIEVEFKELLASERYFFYIAGHGVRPRRWRPGGDVGVDSMKQELPSATTLPVATP